MPFKPARDASASSLGAASTRTGDTLSRQSSAALTRQNSAALSRQSSRPLSRQSSRPLKKQTTKTLLEETGDVGDFDMGAFFNFAEWYGDEPYMAMALNMFEKAPPGSALRSPTMLQVLSRRFKEDREPDPETMDERDKCVSAQVTFTLPSMDDNGSLRWDKVSYKLPVERDRQSREHRIALLKFLDSSNSGKISIDDLKLGFARIVSMPGLEDPEHMLDEVVRHAQTAVQDLMLDGAPRKDEDVLTKEFRVFLTFLQGYLDLWEIFFEVDNSSDEMVALDEFVQAAPKLKEWGLKDPALMKNPAHLFAQIDEDESGYVTFGEFADFCVRKGLMEEVANDLRNI